jgi:hypothetical protein
MSRLIPKGLVDAEQRKLYAGIYVLKKIDLKPKDGGIDIPVVLPTELSPLDEVLQDLAVVGLLEINPKKNRYDLTKPGYAYLSGLIDEAEALIEEFEHWELAETLSELSARRLDPFRARFLWGWYQGEFDDLVQFQRRRGVRPVEPLWAYYLTSPAFFDQLGLDLVSQ